MEEKKKNNSYQSRDGFAALHPVCQFFYFAVVLSFAMFFRHLVFLLLSILGAFFYAWYLKKEEGMHFLCHVILPVILLFAVMNPLFSHEGSTILFYFPNGNPFTKESVFFGIHSGLMLGCVLLWCKNISEIFTSDKIMCVFGAGLPSFALLLSMTFRFLPKLYGQYKKMSELFKGMREENEKKKSVKERLRESFLIFSMLITWALETSVETAESMRARGYGVHHRSFYQSTQFQKKDGFFLVLVLLFTGMEIWGIKTGKLWMHYYPVCEMNLLSARTGIYYGVELLICLMPFMMGVWEEIRWQYLKWKI